MLDYPVIRRHLVMPILVVAVVTISLPAKGAAQQADLDPISWEDFVREQLARFKKHAVDEKTSGHSKRYHDIGRSVVVFARGNKTTNGQRGSTEIKNNADDNHGLDILRNDDDRIVVEYVCKPGKGELECPTLKHYEMFPLLPEDDFYPSWSYFGFRPPGEWHTVPIEFFHEPPPESTNKRENHRIRRHGSAMHLCTEQVSNNIKSCKRLVKNECLNGMPSPIDIMSTEAVRDPKLEEIEFIHYSTHFGFEMFFESDGSQLLFLKLLPRLKDGARPGIRGGPLGPNNELFLDRVIFRTGFDRKQGSEHTIDGQSFGMEWQFYFTVDGDTPYWQALSQYKTFQKNDGSIGRRVHVISVFAQVAEDGGKPLNRSHFLGKGMDTLSKAAQMFWPSVNVNRSSRVRVSKNVFTLEDFFNDPTKGPYYTYQGSLTHPPCLTNVGWTVFENPFWIEFYQWRRFAYVHAEYSDYRVLAGNIRPQSQILVKVDIETFSKMKFLQGEGRLRQTELDEAAENTRQPVLRSQNGVQSSTGTISKTTIVNPKDRGDNKNNTGVQQNFPVGSSAGNPKISHETVKSKRNASSNGKPKITTTTTTEEIPYSTTTVVAYDHLDLYLIRNYADYPKYFARQVRKSNTGMGIGRKSPNEFDYYEDENNPEKSSARCTPHKLSYHNFPLFYAFFRTITMILTNE